VTTALDLITGALRKINVLASGEVPGSAEQADALTVLNDMLDTWSTEHLSVIDSNENVLTFINGKATYSVGNPVMGTFSGIVTQGSNVITGVTVPTGIVLGSNLVAPGVPAAAVVTAIGANTITFTPALPATGTFAAQLVSFTVPGDFPIPRPLRVTNAYTRLTTSGQSNIDYPCDLWSLDQYSGIGLKTQPGPWPKIAFFNSGFPYASLSVWPVPNGAAEFHMWTDSIFGAFGSLTDTVNLGQGYARAIKLCLGLELAPEYGKKLDPIMISQARKAKDALKALNSNPITPSSYDGGIVAPGRADAGWILHGGFQ
jgi:hypothetical protein